MERNIISHFISAAENYPERIAIIEKNSSVSFSKLLIDVRNTAAYFKSKGIEKGDRVLVFVPMSVQLYTNVLALFYIGAVAVFIDQWVNLDRLNQCCKITPCKGFLASFKLRFIKFFIPVVRRIPVNLDPLYKNGNSGINVAEMIETDEALITFTTGSTGIPKAANRTHGFLEAQFDALRPLLETEKEFADMPTLPIVLFLNLAIGRTSLIGNFNPANAVSFNTSAVLQQIRDANIDSITTSPYYALRLADEGRNSSIKKLVTGGAPVFPEDAEKLNSAFFNADIMIVYGSTEAEPIAHISSGDLLMEHGNLKLETGLCVGKIDASARVRIIKITEGPVNIITDEELNKISVGETEIGEICVSGAHVLTGYINNPEAVRLNKIILAHETWHRTGDAGYLKDGKLYLCGRCNNLISKNNRIYSPFIYENNLKLELGRAATILFHQNKITAVIESPESASLRDKIAFSFPEIEEVLFVAAFPRDPRHNSKIDYLKLANDLG